MALLVAYAALCFSMLASILYLIQENRIKKKFKAPGQDSWWAPFDWLPPLDTLERIAHATLEFGFPCMTVGLVIGSVLGQETSLGAAYFRDPKVIASFVSWAIYVLLLLVRRSAGLRGRKAAYLSGCVFLRHDGRLGGESLQPRSQVRSAMTLALIGVNHKTAPIDLRERIAISARRFAGGDSRAGRHAGRDRVHDRLHLQPRGTAGRRRVARCRP